MSTSNHERPVRAGFALLEMMIGVAILLLLVGTLTQSLRSLSQGNSYAEIDGELQAQAGRAMHAVIASLKPSGFVSLDGNSFPYLFEDGNAAGAYMASAHEAPNHSAVAGDPDFGPNREIVFVQPADLDGDNRPDLDAAGQMVWSEDQVSFAVIPRADGTNVLQRRVNGGSIRVRIWLRERDGRGALHRYFTEAVVKLRNG